MASDIPVWCLFQTRGCTSAVFSLFLISYSYLQLKYDHFEFQKICSSFYLIEMCVLSSGQSEAALLGLEGQEAGQQSFCDLQIIPIESGCGLGDVTQLVGKLLLDDGVQLRLITLEGIELNMQIKKNEQVLYT